jgi:hypothetical protein
MTLRSSSARFAADLRSARDLDLDQLMKTFDATLHLMTTTTELIDEPKVRDLASMK